MLLEDGKAKMIVSELINFLNEFDIWEVIKAIICDTTNTNNEAKSGAVESLKKEFIARKLEVPQYIGCQHHVLDLLLKHVMDNIFGSKTLSPNINYFFVDELIKIMMTW